MSEKMPPEFEWIKPGVKCNSEGVPLVIDSFPFYDEQEELWVAHYSTNTRSHFPIACEMLDKTEIVTLTLTREQAEAISEELGGLISYIKQPLGDLYQQIEEKLK